MYVEFKVFFILNNIKKRNSQLLHPSGYHRKQVHHCKLAEKKLLKNRKTGLRNFLLSEESSTRSYALSRIKIIICEFWTRLEARDTHGGMFISLSLQSVLGPSLRGFLSILCIQTPKT